MMNKKETIEYFEKKRKRAHPCDAQYYDTAIAALSSVKDSPAKNNADKIRSMTDEELAEMFLAREGTERHINPRRDFLPLFYAPDGTCCRDRNYALQLWIEWLKQPAEED